MKAFLFPGQGSQFVGMGKELYYTHAIAREMFETANDILDFELTDLMFNGPQERLNKTIVTQPAVFVLSVVLAHIGSRGRPDMVAGHSLGEYSALVASRSITYEEGLKLVYERAGAMQKACEASSSSMAAVIGLDNLEVEDICRAVEETVVVANYNCPGQVVIAGSRQGLSVASEKLTKAGAKRVLPIQVNGAFHSPLMETARKDLEQAIAKTHFETPTCPIYQNIDAKPTVAPERIKSNLIAQLTSPVRWNQTIRAMIENGASNFIEFGRGPLQDFVKKINPHVFVESIR